MKNKTAGKKSAPARIAHFHVSLTPDATQVFEKMVAKSRGRGMVFDGVSLEEAQTSMALLVIMNGLEVTSGLHGVPLPETWQRQFNIKSRTAYLEKSGDHKPTRRRLLSVQ